MFERLQACLREARLRLQVWHQGSLRVNRRGVWEERYVLMQGRELRYFTSQMAWLRGAKEIGSLPLAQIESAKPLAPTAPRYVTQRTATASAG